MNHPSIQERTLTALLVGDNTCSPNWGGRGAGIALYQMLARRFRVFDTIAGSTFLLPYAGFGYVHTLLPPRHNRHFLNALAKRQRSKLFDYYVRLEEFCGAKDFIAPDPAETVQNILRYKGRHPGIMDLYEKARSADVLIINGEGDIVLTTPPRREALFLMGMAELGLHLKKKVVFVNSMVSDCPVTGRNSQTLKFLRDILARCEVVTLRDPESLEYAAREMPEVSCRLIPDSLFAWSGLMEKNRSVVPANGDFILPFPENRNNFGKLDFSVPYICIGGSALADRDQTKAVEHFTRLVQALRKLGCPVYLTENCSGDSFLRAVAEATGAGLIPVNTSIFMGAAILANARLFVSGRYHPSILAALGGTPCVFLQSSAHKMRSLQKLLEYDPVREFPLFPTDAEMKELLELATEYLRQGEKLRQTIRSVADRRCGETSQLPDILLEKNPPALSPRSANWGN